MKVECEQYVSDSGEVLTVIPSGFDGVFIYVIEDYAYNLTVDYFADKIIEGINSGYWK